VLKGGGVILFKDYEGIKIIIIMHMHKSFMTYSTTIHNNIRMTQLYIIYQVLKIKEYIVYVPLA